MKCARCKDFIVVKKPSALGIGLGASLIAFGVALGIMIAVLIPCGAVFALLGILCLFLIKKPAAICAVCATPRQNV
jgi:hypothetical protein